MQLTSYCQARFKRRTLHVPNLMQISKNNSFFSFALGSAHVKFDVCTEPKTQVGMCERHKNSWETCCKMDYKSSSRSTKPEWKEGLFAHQTLERFSSDHETVSSS